MTGRRPLSSSAAASGEPRTGPAAAPGTDRVARWTLLPATAAPVLLLAGVTIAASRQPAPFDPLRDTISASAALDATDRWVMTTALFGLGLAHLGTATGLRLPTPGRLILAIGGAATIGVALFPLPGGDGRSTAHQLVASTAFVALTVWPLGLLRRDQRARPALLRAPGLLTVSGVLAALVCWFGVALATDGPLVGLSERVAAVAQALWPLILVLALRRRRHDTVH